MPRALFVTTLILAAAASAPALPNEALDIHNRARLAQEGRWGELQILDNQRRRMQFQRRQQQHREQDREAVWYRPERLEIPRMQRNCQVQIYGRNRLTGCR